MIWCGSALGRGWKHIIVLLVLVPGCIASGLLLLDRGVITGSDGKSDRLEWTGNDGSLIGDDFSIGREGETWVIDRIRTWIITDNASSAALGERLQAITFLGGLANDQATVECACHNLVPLKTGALREGSSTNPEIMLSQGNIPNVWQVDFKGLRWSVPGGAKIQFAIKAVQRRTPRTSTETLLIAAIPVEGPHHLRLFTKEGGFQSFLDKKAHSSGESLAISIQVWGFFTGKP